MKERSDAQLVASARRGDKAAFGELIERYGSMVNRLARKMVGREQVAQELTQEALLQAYLSLDSLREDERFRPWLYGITLNLCRSFLRRRQADFCSLEELLGGMSVDLLPDSNFEPGPESIAETRDLHRLILKAVKGLSSKNRAATLLFYYEDLSIQETAALLGISTTAVKGRLHKARQQLKIELAALAAPVDTAQKTESRRKQMIEVKVTDVIRKTTEDGEPADYNIITLLDGAGRRLLPIWIGRDSAEAIAHALLERSTSRPLTFTFMANLLNGAGVQLDSVRVESLKDDTFYAIVKLQNGETVTEIDARPSDAIALALQTGSPIYVSDEVMSRAGVDIPAEAKLPGGKGLAEMSQILEERYQAMQTRLQKIREETTTMTEQDLKEKTAQRHRELMAYIFS